MGKKWHLHMLYKNAQLDLLVLMPALAELRVYAGNNSIGTMKMLKGLSARKSSFSPDKLADFQNDTERRKEGVKISTTYNISINGFNRDN